MSLYICVHRSVEPLPFPPNRPPLGRLIDLGTRLRWGGIGGVPPAHGWTFPDGPATHAFVVMTGPDGGLYRVDAHAPKVTSTPLPDGLQFDCPTAAWEVVDAPAYGVSRAGGEAAAYKQALTGAPYDPVACAVQALAIVLPPVLSGAVPYRGPDESRIICTEAACEVLAACGGPAKRLAADVMDRDHYPEELGYKLYLSEGTWLRRIPDARAPDARVKAPVA